MTTTNLGAWLDKVASTEDATTASVTIEAGKENKADPANAVPGEHTEKGQGSMDAKDAKVKVNKPEDLGVTDTPHRDDGENQINKSADEGIKANGDKAPGSKTLSDQTISTEAEHPTEPVIGGKMPDESKMDENPRGTVTHVDGKQDVDLTKTDLEMPGGEDESLINPNKELDTIADKNPGTHEPQQTKEARKQLEGEFHSENGKVNAVSIEASSDLELLQESGVNTSAVETPAAPVGDTGADASDAANAEQADMAAEANAEAAVAGEGTAPTEDAPPTELGAAIAELANEADPVQEASAHMDQVATDLDDFNKANVAVEAYIELLEKHRANNEGLIDPILARSVQIGLESFGEPFMIQGTFASLEGFEDATGRFQVSKEAMEDLKGKNQELLKAARNALAKLFEWLQDLWNRFMADAPKLREKVSAIKAKVAQIKEVNDATMPVAGAERLYVGDVFAGDNPRVIAELNKTAQSFLVQYPKMVHNMLNEYVGQLTRNKMSLNAEAVGQAAVIAFEGNFKPELIGLKKTNEAQIPGDFKKFTAVVSTAPLPGNMAFYAGLKPKEFIHQGQSVGAHVTAVARSEGLFKMGFERIPGTNPSAHKDVVKAPDQGVLTSMLQGVEQLITTLEDMRATKAEMGGIKKDLDKAMSWSATTMDFQTLAIAHSLMQSMARYAATPVGSFSGYLGSIIKVYLAVIDRFASHHLAYADPQGQEGEFRDVHKGLPAPA